MKSIRWIPHVAQILPLHKTLLSGENEDHIIVRMKGNDAYKMLA